MEHKRANFEILEQLATIVGKEKAYEICVMFAGEQIFFPKGIVTAKRDFDIRKEFRKGDDYKSLSSRYDLTTRRIREICNTEKM